MSDLDRDQDLEVLTRARKLGIRLTIPQQDYLSKLAKKRRRDRILSVEMAQLRAAVETQERALATPREVIHLPAWADGEEGVYVVGHDSYAVLTEGAADYHTVVGACFLPSHLADSGVITDSLTLDVGAFEADPVGTIRTALEGDDEEDVTELMQCVLQSLTYQHRGLIAKWLETADGALALELKRIVQALDGARHDEVHAWPQAGADPVTEAQQRDQQAHLEQVAARNPSLYTQFTHREDLDP